MRWWVRLLVTLALAPPSWWLARAYVASHQGAAWDELLPTAGKALFALYLTYSLPALALLVLLFAADRLLGVLRVALLGVVVSPVLAALVAAAALRAAQALSLERPAALLDQGFALFVTYGLVWGLTIREPPRGRPARRRSAAPAPDPPPA